MRPITVRTGRIVLIPDVEHSSHIPDSFSSNPPILPMVPAIPINNINVRTVIRG